MHFSLRTSGDVEGSPETSRALSCRQGRWFLAPRRSFDLVSREIPAMRQRRSLDAFLVQAAGDFQPRTPAPASPPRRRGANLPYELTAKATIKRGFA